MKKENKHNYKFILGIIVGGLIFGSISIYASQLLGKDIGFIPANSNWNVTNVEDAINDLYERTSECVKGAYHHEVNTQWNIDVGFKPSSFLISFSRSTEVGYLFNNSTKDDTTIVVSSTNKGPFYTAYYEYIYSNNNGIESSFPTSSVMYSEAFDVQYVVCK